MYRESWKVFVACALGAGIGSLVALELNQWLWWIGLIVGGLTGYLTYEFKKVLRAIPAAWKAANGVVIPWQFWGTIALMFMAIFWIIFWAISPAMVLAAIVEDPKLAPGLVMCASMMGLIGIIASFGITVWESTNPRSPSLFDSFKHANWRLCPVFVIFWHLPRGVWRLYNIAPRFFSFCKCFGWQMFIRIHSERRLLCGVDAMLGAGVGYFAGSAIIGALAGGVFGLINYAVVTKRVLEPRGFLPAR